jgi:hypothetical protein
MKKINWINLIGLTILGALSLKISSCDFSWIGRTVKAKMSYELDLNLLLGNTSKFDEIMSYARSFMNISEIWEMQDMTLFPVIKVMRDTASIRTCLPDAPLLNFLKACIKSDRKAAAINRSLLHQYGHEWGKDAPSYLERFLYSARQFCDKAYILFYSMNFRWANRYAPTLY